MDKIISFFPADFNPLAVKKGSFMDNLTTELEKTPASSHPMSVDVIDLMYELLHMRKPDVFVDAIIDQLVGNVVRLEPLSISMTRFRSWLSSQTPHYTGSEKALNLLANRLGYRVEVSKVDGKDMFVGIAYDVTKRKRTQALGFIAGTAGILALLRLAIKEQEK